MVFFLLILIKIQESHAQRQSHQPNGAHETGSVNNGSGTGGRSRFSSNGKHHHAHHNYNNGKTQKPPVSAVKQRVPNADDFPVLAGTVTPPSKSCVTTNGPTAAQVLQAPPPVKKESVAVVVVNGSEPSNAHLNTPERARSPATSTKVCI